MGGVGKNRAAAASVGMAKSDRVLVEVTVKRPVETLEQAPCGGFPYCRAPLCWPQKSQSPSTSLMSPWDDMTFSPHSRYWPK